MSSTKLTKQLKNKANNSEQIVYDALKESSRLFNRYVKQLSDRLDECPGMVEQHHNNVIFLEDFNRSILGSLAIISRFRDARTYLMFLSQTKSVGVNQAAEYERDEYVKRVEYAMRNIVDLKQKHPSVGQWCDSFVAALSEMRNFINSNKLPTMDVNREHYANVLMGYNVNVNSRVISVDEQLTKKFIGIVLLCQRAINQDFVKHSPLTVSDEYEQLTGMTMAKEIGQATSDRNMIINELTKFANNSDNAIVAERNSSSALRLNNALNVIYGVNATEIRNVCMLLPADISADIDGADNDTFARDCYSFGDEPARVAQRSNRQKLQGEKLREAIDVWTEFFTNYYDSYIGLCEAAQALDKLLMDFTEIVRVDPKMFEQFANHLSSARTFNYTHGNIEHMSDHLVDIFDPNGCYLIDNNTHTEASKFGQLRPSIDPLFNRVPSKIAQQQQVGIDNSTRMKYTADARARTNDRYSVKSKLSAVREYYQYDTSISSIMMLFNTLMTFNKKSYSEAGMNFAKIRRAVEHYLCKGVYKIDFVADSNNQMSCIDMAHNNAFNLLDTNARISLVHVNDVDYVNFPLSQTTIHGKGHYLVNNMIKSLISKTMTVLGAYDLQDYVNNRPFRISRFDTARTMLGKGVESIPTVIPEAAELYIRLPLLVEFYRTVFHKSPMGSSQITMGVTIDEPFASLINTIFITNRKSTIAEYSQYEMYRIMHSINKIYETYREEAKNANMPILRFVVYKLIKAVNGAYGILNRYDYGKMIEYASEFLDIKHSKLVELDFDFDDDVDKMSYKALPSQKYLKDQVSTSTADSSTVANINESLSITSNIDILKNFRKRVFSYLLDNSEEESYDSVANIFGLNEMMSKLKHDVSVQQTNEGKFREVFKIISNERNFTTPDTVRLALAYDMIFTTTTEVNEIVSFMENAAARFSAEGTDSIPAPISRINVTVNNEASYRFKEVEGTASRLGSMFGLSNLLSLVMTDYGTDYEVLLNSMRGMNNFTADESQTAVASILDNRTNLRGLAHMILYSNDANRNMHEEAIIDSSYRSMFSKFHQQHNVNNYSLGDNISARFDNSNYDNLPAVMKPLIKYYNNSSWRVALANMIKQDFTKTLRKILLHPNLFTARHSVGSGMVEMNFDEARAKCASALDAISSISQEITATGNTLDPRIRDHMVNRITTLRHRLNNVFRSDANDGIRNLNMMISGHFDELIAKCIPEIRTIVSQMPSGTITEGAIISMCKNALAKLMSDFWAEFLPNGEYSFHRLQSALVENYNIDTHSESKPFRSVHMISLMARNSCKLELNDLVYAEPNPECFNADGNFAFDVVSYFNHIVATYLKGVIGSDGRVLGDAIDLGLDDCSVIDNTIRNINKIKTIPLGVNYSDTIGSKFNVTNPKYSSHRGIYAMENFMGEMHRYAICDNTHVSDIVPVHNGNASIAADTAHVFRPVNALCRTITFPDTYGVYSLNGSSLSSNDFVHMLSEMEKNADINTVILRRASVAFDVMLRESRDVLKKLVVNMVDNVGSKVLKAPMTTEFSTIADFGNLVNYFSTFYAMTRIEDLVITQNAVNDTENALYTKFRANYDVVIIEYYTRILKELESGYINDIAGVTSGNTAWVINPDITSTNPSCFNIQNLRHLLSAPKVFNNPEGIFTGDDSPYLNSDYFRVAIDYARIAQTAGSVSAGKFLSRMSNISNPTSSDIILSLASLSDDLDKVLSVIGTSTNAITDPTKVGNSYSINYSNFKDITAQSLIGLYALPRSVSKKQTVSMDDRSSHVVGVSVLNKSDSAKALYGWANHSMVFNSVGKWSNVLCPAAEKMDHFASSMDKLLNDRLPMSWVPRADTVGVLLRSTSTVIRNLKNNTDGSGVRTHIVQSINDLSDKHQAVYSITGSITFAMHHLTVLQKLLSVLSSVDGTMSNNNSNMRLLQELTTRTTNMMSRLHSLEGTISVHRTETIKYGAKSYFDNINGSHTTLLASNASNYMLDGASVPTIVCNHTNFAITKRAIDNNVFNGLHVSNNAIFPEFGVKQHNYVKFANWLHGSDEYAAVLSRRGFSELPTDIRAARRHTSKLQSHDPFETKDIGTGRMANYDGVEPNFNESYKEKKHEASAVSKEEVGHIRLTYLRKTEEEQGIAFRKNINAEKNIIVVENYGQFHNAVGGTPEEVKSMAPYMVDDYLSGNINSPNIVFSPVPSDDINRTRPLSKLIRGITPRMANLKYYNQLLLSKVNINEVMQKANTITDNKKSTFFIELCNKVSAAMNAPVNGPNIGISSEWVDGMAPSERYLLQQLLALKNHDPINGAIGVLNRPTDALLSDGFRASLTNLVPYNLELLHNIILPGMYKLLPKGFDNKNGIVVQNRNSTRPIMPPKSTTTSNTVARPTRAAVDIKNINAEYGDATFNVVGKQIAEPEELTQYTIADYLNFVRLILIADTRLLSDTTAKTIECSALIFARVHAMAKSLFNVDVAENASSRLNILRRIASGYANIPNCTADRLEYDPRRVYDRGVYYYLIIMNGAISSIADQLHTFSKGSKYTKARRSTSHYGDHLAVPENPQISRLSTPPVSHRNSYEVKVPRQTRTVGVERFGSGSPTESALKFLVNYLKSFDTDLFSKPYNTLYIIACDLIAELQPSFYQENIQDQDNVTVKSEIINTLTKYMNYPDISQRVNVTAENLELIKKNTKLYTKACALVGLKSGFADVQEQILLKEIIVKGIETNRIISFNIATPDETDVAAMVSMIDSKTDDEIRKLADSMSQAPKREGFSSSSVEKYSDHRSNAIDVDSKYCNVLMSSDYFWYVPFDVTPYCASGNREVYNVDNSGMIMKEESTEKVVAIIGRRENQCTALFVSNHGSTSLYTHSNMPNDIVNSILNEINIMTNMPLTQYPRVTECVHANASNWAVHYKSIANLYASNKCFYDMLTGRDVGLSMESLPYIKSLLSAINSENVAKLSNETILSICKLFGVSKFTTDDDPFALRMIAHYHDRGEMIQFSVNDQVKFKSSLMYNIQQTAGNNFACLQISNALNDVAAQTNAERFTKIVTELINSSIVNNGENIVSVGASLQDKESLMKLNILDLGVMPIDIHAMTREIPLAFVLNYSAALDDYILEHTGGAYISEDVVEARYPGDTKVSENKLRRILGSVISGPETSSLPNTFEYMFLKNKAQLERSMRNQNSYVANNDFTKSLFTNFKLNAMHKFLDNIYMSTSSTITDANLVGLRGVTNYDAYRPYNALVSNPESKNQYLYNIRDTLASTIRSHVTNEQVNVGNTQFDLFNDFYPVMDATSSAITMRVDDNVSSGYYGHLVRFGNGNYSMPMNNLISMAFTMCGNTDTSLTSYDGILMLDRMHKYFTNSVLTPLSSNLSTTGNDYLTNIYSCSVPELSNKPKMNLGLGISNIPDGSTLQNRAKDVQKLHVLSKALYTDQGFGYTFSRNIIASSFWYNAMRHQLTTKLTSNKFDVLISNQHLFAKQK